MWPTVAEIAVKSSFCRYKTHTGELRSASPLDYHSSQSPTLWRAGCGRHRLGCTVDTLRVTRPIIQAPRTAVARIAPPTPCVSTWSTGRATRRREPPHPTARRFPPLRASTHTNQSRPLLGRHTPRRSHTITTTITTTAVHSPPVSALATRRGRTPPASITSCITSYAPRAARGGGAEGRKLHSCRPRGGSNPEQPATPHRKEAAPLAPASRAGLSLHSGCTRPARRPVIAACPACHRR